MMVSSSSIAVSQGPIPIGPGVGPCKHRFRCANLRSCGFVAWQYQMPEARTRRSSFFSRGCSSHMTPSVHLLDRPDVQVLCSNPNLRRAAADPPGICCSHLLAVCFYRGPGVCQGASAWHPIQISMPQIYQLLLLLGAMTTVPQNHQAGVHKTDMVGSCTYAQGCCGNHILGV